MHSVADHRAGAIRDSLKIKPSPTVSIIICTRNRPEPLQRCLKAIARLDPAPDEVIVVDNSAGDKSTESAARESGARYVVVRTPGLSRARNRGLQESNCEIIAYLDDDAIPDERWLESLVEPFAEPQVAVVTGETMSPQSVCEADSSMLARRLSNRDPQWFEIATFGGLGSIGANMALRKSACAGWKGFDERLGRGTPLHGFEEHYAIAHLLTLGYAAVHAPAAVVTHPSKTASVEEEASRAVAYWWFLFSQSPGHRLELIQFLFKRLRRKPLSWHRNPPGFGPIISSGWRVRMKAALAGTMLYLRAGNSNES